MRQSEINFSISLDQDNVPEKITWNASDKPEGSPSETKSIAISLWDHEQRNTMRIDLWTKEMPVDDMKRFYIDCLGGMAQSILNSTSDEFMSTELNALCDKFVKHLQQELDSK